MFINKEIYVYEKKKIHEDEGNKLGILCRK